VRFTKGEARVRLTHSVKCPNTLRLLILGIKTCDEGDEDGRNDGFEQTEENAENKKWREFPGSGM